MKTRIAALAAVVLITLGVAVYGSSNATATHPWFNEVTGGHLTAGSGREPAYVPDGPVPSVCFYRNGVFNRCDATANPYQMYPPVNLVNGDVIEARVNSQTVSTFVVGQPATTTTAPPATTTPPTTVAPPPTTVVPGCTPPAGPMYGALPSQPGPVHCSIVNTGPTTFVNGTNSWLDDFDHGLSFADIGAGYLTFDSGTRVQHWRHADHWMADLELAGGDTEIGTALRPDRSFRFVDGRLIVETVVAAAIDVYGDPIWPEIVVSTQSAPSWVTGGLYVYDMFPEGHTVGCRLQASRHPVCASKIDNGRNATPSDPGGLSRREWEISNFQHVGSSVYGGGPYGPLADVWRTCNQTTGDNPDTVCRDLFRLELTATSLALYVNDVLYFEQTGLAPALAPAFVNGDVYVYLAGMSSRAPTGVARFHWDRVAVN